MIPNPILIRLILWIVLFLPLSIAWTCTGRKVGERQLLEKHGIRQWTKCIDRPHLSYEKNDHTYHILGATYLLKIDSINSVEVTYPNFTTVDEEAFKIGPDSLELVFLPNKAPQALPLYLLHDYNRSIFGPFVTWTIIFLGLYVSVYQFLD